MVGRLWHRNGRLYRESGGHDVAIIWGSVDVKHRPWPRYGDGGIVGFWEYLGEQGGAVEGFSCVA